MSDSNFVVDPTAPTGTGPSGNRPQAPATDYRSLQAPVMPMDAHEFARLGGTGQAQEAEALAHAFKSFSGTVNEFGIQLGAKAGAAAGAQAGLDPAFQPKTGLASITAYGSAYDAAAHVSYVNATQAAVEAQLSQAEQDNAGNPQGFATAAEAIHNATVKNAPLLYQPEISNMIQLRTVAGMTRTREQAITTARSDAWESYTSTVDSRQRTAVQTASQLPPDQQAALVQNTIAENRTQLDALVQARAITPEKSAILQQHFIDTFKAQINGAHTAATVDQLMDYARAGDVDKADAAMHAYQIDPNNSTEDKIAVLHDYETQREAFTKLQSQVHANDLAAVGQQLVQGEGQVNGQGAYGSDIEARIHQLYKQGAINPEGLHSLMDQSMRNQVKAIGDNVDNINVDAVVHGQAPKLDPKDPDAQKAVDTYFQTHMKLQGVQPGTDSYAIGAAAIVQETNIVPKSVQSQIRIGLMNGDANSAVVAARLAERITNTNPQAEVYQNDPKLAAFSALLNDNIRAGLPVQQAYNLAVAHTNITPAEKEIRDKAYADAIKKQSNGNADAANNIALQKQLNSTLAPHFWQGNPPPAPIPMQAEYEALTKQFFQNTGDLGKAQQLAGQQLMKTWGVTHVNGAPEIVKYPVSDAEAPLIRADVAKTAAAIGYTGDPAQIRLTPNALTDQSSGRYWSLTHQDANGVTDTLLDSHNQPIVYDRRLSPQTYAQARQAQIDQKLDEARKQRDFERSVAADQILGEKQLSDFYLTPQGRRSERSAR